MSYNLIIKSCYENDASAENALTELSKVSDCTNISRTNDIVKGDTTGEKRHLQNDLEKIKLALRPNCTEGYIDAYLHHDSICIGTDFEE